MLLLSIIPAYQPTQLLMFSCYGNLEQKVVVVCVCVCVCEKGKVLLLLDKTRSKQS